VSCDEHIDLPFMGAARHEAAMCFQYLPKCGIAAFRASRRRCRPCRDPARDCASAQSGTGTLLRLNVNTGSPPVLTGESNRKARWAGLPCFVRVLGSG
jgi:hypothetical protein